MKHELIPIARHRWIHIARQQGDVVAASCGDASMRSTVARWLGAGRPLIARARQPGEPLHLHPAGLCLPRASAVRRVALAIPAEAIESVSDATSLHEALGALPPDAAQVAGEIAGYARELGFEARAYGSLAWQARTGEEYLHAASDLDILGTPPDAHALRAWLAVLARLDASSPMRLDGEVECPEGSAVSWRELAQAPAEVLVKDLDSARLEATAAFLARFP